MKVYIVLCYILLSSTHHFELEQHPLYGRPIEYCNGLPNRSITSPSPPNFNVGKISVSPHMQIKNKKFNRRKHYHQH